MLANMSRREKLLAGAVGSTAILFLLFIGFISFNSKYQLGKTELRGVQKQIDDERKKLFDGMLAQMRKKFVYLPSSFPSGGQVNITRYQNWLLRLQRECKFPRPNLGKPDRETLKYGVDGRSDGVAGQLYAFRFDTVVTLDQVLQFCHKFESMDFLHKIKVLTLTPLRDKSKELTGECKASFSIEVLAMSEADEETDFDQRVTELAQSREDYEKVIVSRNIFGPANNAPTIRVSSKKYDNDEEVSYSVSARDKDKDNLKIEIVDNGGLEGATLEQKEGSDRATFKHDKLPNGDYEIVFRVTDDGYPAKSAEATWKFTVKDPPVRTVEKKDPEPVEPPFQHATETRITRISGRNGVFAASIKVLTTGDVFNLKMGSDSKSDTEFELDGEKWIVRDISAKIVKLESGGKLMAFRKGSVLSDPVNVVELEKPTSIDNEDEVGEVSVSTGK